MGEQFYELFENTAEEGEDPLSPTFNVTLLIHKVQPFNYSFLSSTLITFRSPESTILDDYASITLTSKESGQSTAVDKLYYTQKVASPESLLSAISALPP